MRIDKYIWSVRLFKTRSLAKEACEKERVKFNGAFTKPAKEVTPGDHIAIKTLGQWRTFVVEGIPKSRVGPKLVAEHLRETTESVVSEAIAQTQRMNAENRNIGIVGRPTKKDRRAIDKFRA